MDELERLRQMYLQTYGVDPEEEPALPGYAELSNLAPESAQSPIVDPWAPTPLAPEARDSLVDPFPASPAPEVPAAESPVTAQPIASGSISETTPSVVVTPKYDQSGTPITGDDPYARIGKARNPGVEAGRLTSGILANDAMRAEELLGQYTDAAQGEAGVEREASLEASKLAEQRAAEIRQMRVEAENQIRSSDDDIRTIASTEPDPGRFWSTRSAGQKALYYITAALQAFSKPEEVPKVSELLLKFIDDDIARQKDRIGAELDAAKGRASSVREMIVAGKSDAEAIHGQRTVRFEAMKRGAMAKWVAAGKTAAATKEYNDTIGALGQAEAKSFSDTADATMKLRQQSAQIALQKRELQYRMDKDAAAAQAAAQGAPENARFPSGNAVVTDASGKQQPWVVLVKESLKENTMRAPAFDGAMSAIDDLESYVAEQQAKGRPAIAISKDPEFRSRMARSVRPIAQSLGYEKNISDKEAEQLSDAIMGGAVPDSFRDTTIGAFATTMQLNPKNIGESIGRVRQGVSGSYSSWLSTNADPNYYGGRRPDVVIPAKRPSTREQDISSTIGAKAGIDSRQRAAVGDVTASFLPSQSYDAMREVARNTMDKQDVSDLALAVSSIPEGTPERAKAQALLDRVTKVKSVNPARLPSHERDQYMMDVISLNKELGK